MGKFKPAGPLLLVAALGVFAFTPAARAASPTRWVGTWAAAPQPTNQWNPIPNLVDSTFREIVHTSLAGKELRVNFTNEFGTEPLRIDAASVALAADTTTSSIQSGSSHPLTFDGQPSIVIPPGAMAVSDPVPMATPAFANLAISFYLPVQTITHVSFHSDAQQNNFIVRGNHISDASLASPRVVQSWYFLKGVDVVPTVHHAAAVVAFGDSITDGYHSTMNTNHRWPNYLAVRLHDNPATANLSVLDEGISGNCVLITCIGPNALSRYNRDVLSLPGVKYVIILESINDIGALHNVNQPDYKLTAADLEQGLAQMVARAHEHGIKVFGATLTPYKGAFYYTHRGEKIREQVNHWIRTSGVFDGVVDFDKATRDPQNPLTYLPKYDSGDHLHPGDTGYSAMANSINLSLFQ